MTNHYISTFAKVYLAIPRSRSLSSDAKRDVLDAVSWNLGVFIVAVDAKRDVCAGWDGGCPAERFSKPAVSSPLVHPHRHLQRPEIIMLSTLTSAR